MTNPIADSGPLLVDARHLHKVFRAAHGSVTAVKDISLSIRDAMCVGLVGESGSGKTTTARMVVGLERPTGGALHVDGIDPYGGSRRHAQLSRVVTMIFQDPYQSLSPRMRVGRAVEYPLLVQGTPVEERTGRVREVFEQVGLPRAAADRFPHQLSTGQRQRVGIARALITRPRLIVADEPLSSVDVSLQSQILNLLADIQRQTKVAYLVISHDLAVVGQLCDHIIVMKDGDVVEEGAAAALLASPRSEYTAKLIAAAGLA
jgi:peptide/nickel transport system ATP-binding protein